MGEEINLDTTGVRWDDAVDGTALCSKLFSLSKITRSEMLRGLALFVRTHLPYPGAFANDAALELLDLMYYGENRAWLASLAGNVPQVEIREQAADLCVERLKAGADRPWERALADMPSSVADSRMRELADCNNHELACRVLSATGTYVRAPSRELRSRLLEIAIAEPVKIIGGNFELLRPIGKLLLAVPAANEAQVDAKIDQARAILADYLTELDPNSKFHCSHYPAIATFLDNGDPGLRQKCERMLLESVERDGGDVAYAADALMSVCSPLLGLLLAAVCAKGNVEQLYEVAEHLGRLGVDSKARHWLESAIFDNSDESDFGSTWLGCALGNQLSRNQAWQEMRNTQDAGRSLTLLCALVLGGDLNGLTCLLLLQKQILDMILDNHLRPDTEQGQSYMIVLLGLYAAAATMTHLPEEAPALRWKALLEPLMTVPDDKVLKGTMHDYVRWVLFGMVKMCQAGQLPQGITANSSAHYTKIVQFPSSLEFCTRLLGNGIKQATSSAQAVCEQVQLWAEIRAQLPNWHYRSISVLAHLAAGDDPPWEDDQCAAADYVQANIARAVQLGNAGRFCEGIEIWLDIIATCQRVPVWGSDRYKLLSQMEFGLANAYGFVANGEETAHTTTSPHPHSDQAKFLAERHCKRSFSLALEVDDPDLQARACDTLNKIRAIGQH